MGCFVLDLLGLQKLTAMIFGKDTSILMLWYGLYFGILGRDTAEVAFSGLVRSHAVHQVAHCGDA